MIEFRIRRWAMQLVSMMKVNNKRREDNSFRAAADRFIEAARLERRPSTVDNYRTAVRSFQRFLGGRDIGCGDVTDATIRQYAKWLGDEGVCPNTRSCYMRSLRRVMTGCGIDTAGLFSGIFTGNAKTRKRAIDAADIDKLARLSLQQGTFRAMARDLFLFSFFALGMPFADMAYLRKEQVSDGYLTYHRRKTGQTVRVRVEPCMQQIIDRYSRDDSPYLLPLLTGGDAATADRQRRRMLNRYNRTLKVLARQAGITCHLTSYTPRHSWATLAYSRSVDLPVIAQALGHTNPQTTLIYIREIDTERLDNANRMVINSCFFEQM